MKLRYDPFHIFQSSRTPAGLYARQKWLGEADAPQWTVDYQATVNALLADQLTDGSWNNSAVATIRKLFGLHLTVRSATAQIDAALTWLIKKIDLQTEDIHVRANDFVTDVDLAGLPFVPSRPDMFLTSTALFWLLYFATKVVQLSWHCTCG